MHQKIMKGYSPLYKTSTIQAISLSLIQVAGTGQYDTDNNSVALFAHQN